jgi:MFS family permease
MGLKLAPRGRGTAYLAAGSIVNSVAAGLAPIVGGLFADDFAARELSLILRWTSGPEATEFVTLRLRHWDFFFLLAAVLGLYALHRLTLVHEQGHTTDNAMLQEVTAEARRAVASLSSVAGLRLMTAFPFGRIVQAARVKRAVPREPS